MSQSSSTPPKAAASVALLDAFLQRRGRTAQTDAAKPPSFVGRQGNPGSPGGVSVVSHVPSPQDHTKLLPVTSRFAAAYEDPHRVLVSLSPSRRLNATSLESALAMSSVVSALSPRDPRFEGSSNRIRTLEEHVATLAKDMELLKASTQGQRQGPSTGKLPGSSSSGLADAVRSLTHLSDAQRQLLHFEEVLQPIITAEEVRENPSILRTSVLGGSALTARQALHLASGAVAARHAMHADDGSRTPMRKNFTTTSTKHKPEDSTKARALLGAPIRSPPAHSDSFRLVQQRSDSFTVTPPASFTSAPEALKDDKTESTSVKAPVCTPPTKVLEVPAVVITPAPAPAPPPSVPPPPPPTTAAVPVPVQQSIPTAPLAPPPPLVAPPNNVPVAPPTSPPPPSRTVEGLAPPPAGLPPPPPRAPPAAGGPPPPTGLPPPPPRAAGLPPPPGGLPPPPPRTTAASADLPPPPSGLPPPPPRPSGPLPFTPPVGLPPPPPPPPPPPRR